MTPRSTPRSSFLATTLALGLLAGCSSNTRAPVETRTADSGGSPPSETVVDATARPAPEAQPKAGATAVYVVRDSGVRCMAAPCPSLIAEPVGRAGESLRITDVDLSALSLSQEQKEHLMNQVHGGPGVRVEATVNTAPSAGPAGDGTVLRVNRVLEGN